MSPRCKLLSKKDDMNSSIRTIREARAKFRWRCHSSPAKSHRCRRCFLVICIFVSCNMFLLFVLNKRARDFHFLSNVAVSRSFVTQTHRTGTVRMKLKLHNLPSQSQATGSKFCTIDHHCLMKILRSHI